MTEFDGRGRAVAVTLLACLLLAGCGATPMAHGPGSPTTGPLASTAPASPESSEPVVLPWPAAGAADAAALQAAVDGGAQPWLLDPSEVAISYTAAAHGWTAAEAYLGPDGTTVEVRNTGGERVTLTLAQPGRTGNAGIWVVTGERPT